MVSVHAVRCVPPRQRGISLVFTSCAYNAATYNAATGMAPVSVEWIVLHGCARLFGPVEQSMPNLAAAGRQSSV